MTFRHTSSLHAPLRRGSLCCDVCTKSIIQFSISTAAADCNAPNWSVPHYVVPIKNSPSPAMRRFVKNVWPLVRHINCHNVHSRCTEHTVVQLQRYQVTTTECTEWLTVRGNLSGADEVSFVGDDDDWSMIGSIAHVAQLTGDELERLLWRDRVDQDDGADWAVFADVIVLPQQHVQRRLKTRP